MQKKAVVLYSGGLDSTTCMAMAKADGFLPYALSFAYGQRHSVELEKAQDYAPQIGAAAHQVAQMLNLTQGHARESSLDFPKMLQRILFGVIRKQTKSKSQNMHVSMKE